MKKLFALLFFLIFFLHKTDAAVGCSTYNGLYPNSNNTINPSTGNVYYKNTNYIAFRTWDEDPRCGIRDNKITSMNVPCDVIGVENYGVLVNYNPADNSCVQVPIDDYIIPIMVLIGGVAFLRIRGI